MDKLLEDLYDNYHQDLYQFIFYTVRNKQLTEDLVQDVYTKILRSNSSFRGESSKKTWLFSIARHTIIDYFRSKRRRNNLITSFLNKNKQSELLVEDLLLEDAKKQRLYDLLNKCTSDQRSVLILRFLQSFSIKETAEILSFSESKVKTTQHRALKMLRVYLKETGGDINDF